MIWSNKHFPSLNVMNVKSCPYGRMGILRQYHVRSDPKLGISIVAIGWISCSFHACTTLLSLYWVSKISKSFNHPRYGRVYNCKCSKIIGCHNNWIKVLIYYGKYEEEYKHNNKNILDGNMMNMSLIILEGNYRAIDADYSSCQGYYIINFYSSQYSLQTHFSNGAKVISSGEIVCERTHFFPINIDSRYYVIQEKKSTTYYFL